MTNDPKKIIIPRREPELIEADARRHWHGDFEKVATAAIKSVTVCGVKITSRYNKAHELELMANILLAMAASVSGKISSLSCDSKNDTYTVVLRDWDADVANNVGAKLEIALLNTRDDDFPFRGHNGIWVEAPGGDPHIILDPNWVGD
jgi:hypothetical protein